MSSIKDLQLCYAAHCDGDWEHSYGVRIESFDNPGWLLRIDLRGTELEHRAFESASVPPGTQRWAHLQLKECVWEAACDPLSLEWAIETFLAWAGRAE